MRLDEAGPGEQKSTISAPAEVREFAARSYGTVGAMPIFRETMIVELVLPSSAAEESLPLTTEREFGVFLRTGARSIPAKYFRSPINDEQWRTFVRQLRDCNVNHDDTGYRGAVAIRGLGKALYGALAELSPELRTFLDRAGVPRRLVIQTTRPELHLLPWAALYDLGGKLLAAGDLSVVQSWQRFEEAPKRTLGRLNLVRVLGADTNKSTGISLAGLPPEITQNKDGPPEILHMEEHGNAVLCEIGGESATAVARSYAGASLALLWSCYSSAGNSWGESPALALHRGGAGLVLSFQAELHNLDARTISQAFYADVFGPAASRDPESALVRIRAAKFAAEFECANWASMTVYLSNPLDLSAMALNGPRVPAAAWLAEAADVPAVPVTDAAAGAAALADDSWAKLAEAVGRLNPGSVVGMDAPFASGAAGEFVKLPLAAMKAWRGNVIRLDGPTEPLPQAAIAEMNLPPGQAPKTDASDRLVWFFEGIARYGSPLIVWTNALERHVEFVKTIAASGHLTFLLLYGAKREPTLPEMVDLNLLQEAQAASESIPEECADDEVLSAAYFAWARSKQRERAQEFLGRIKSTAEKMLLSGNFVSRFGAVPGVAGEAAAREVKDLERRHEEEDFYRQAAVLSGVEGGLNMSGRAKHELGYLMGVQGRTGTAEIFYRAALDDLERSLEHDSRWESALAGTLRDWADLLSKDDSRLGEATKLLRRAMAMHTFRGRRLATAYSLVTWAQIALTGCHHADAVARAMDAAVRFEECSNSWGWRQAIKILLDSLAETRETVRMQSVIHLALEKNKLAGGDADTRQMLVYQLARAHWIAGEPAEAKKALEVVFAEAGDDFADSEMGQEASRLHKFLALSPAML